MPSPNPYVRPPGPDALVSPVHLAGPGPGKTVFNILDHAPGWTKVVAFGTDTYYTSPCQRVRIANPVESHYGGWTIAYAEDQLGVPDWITTFDRNTPEEIVAAFTDRLVAGLHNNFADYLGGGKHYTTDSPATLLTHHGWEPIHGSRPYFRSLSPDGHAAYEMRVGWLHEYDELLSPEKSTWRISAGPDPVYAPSWRAYFSRYTPQPLITAATVILTDPTPVPRTVALLPDRHRPLITAEPLRIAPAVPRAAVALARSTVGDTAHVADSLPSAATSPSRASRPRRQR
ncbi:DUF317 domain-containing protein [Streptomyces shenzhenensis]|uniref:DUF317 domain-containing protein n=1 Tax=Streptomyces shenzhenensis TaxID=943815 RepID=UPI003400C4D6